MALGGLTPILFAMLRAVFLDRDNTLIANDGDLGDPTRVELLDGVANALRTMHEAGYRLIVVTNQGGVARGTFTEADVDAVNQKIAALADEQAGADGLIDRFYYCPYHPEGTVEAYARDHFWRKPQPGMIVQAARDLDLALDESWMVGDQARDVTAGRRAGCRTILVNSSQTVIDEARPTHTASSLADAARIIADSAIRHPEAGDTPVDRRSPPGGPPRDAPGGGVNRDPMIQLRRTMLELIDELRTDRLRRGEFTVMRLVAGVLQLVVILLVLLTFLFKDHGDQFWMLLAGAGLVQLGVIAALLWDSRG